MGLIKCKDCDKEVSTSADKCPNCGRPIKKKLLKGCLLLILCLILLLFAGYLVLHFVVGFEAYQQLQEMDQQKQELTQTEQLELLSTHKYNKKYYITVTGKVKNITNRELDVTVILEWYDSKGNFITSKDEYMGSIFPDQISPFEVDIDDDFKVSNYKISFKQPFGEPILFKDSRELK